MSIGNHFNVSPLLHRSLYRYSLKNFIENELHDRYEEVKESYQDIDFEDSLGFSRFLDRCLRDDHISIESFTRFVIEELNYGRQRNMYVSFLMDCSFLNNEALVIEKINDLNLTNEHSVTMLPYSNGLLDGVSPGEKRLIYSDVIKDDTDITSVRLVFGNHIYHDAAECNNYVAVEINIPLKLLVVKVRNWKDDNEHTSNTNQLAEEIKIRIKAAFNLHTPLMTNSSQRLVRRMTMELTESVLKPTRDIVDAKIKSEIHNKSEEWLKSLSNKNFSTTDLNYLEDAILNNFYRLYMHNEIGKLSNDQLFEIYNVAGYPVNVKFTDDTIGEARAKSADTSESLLDTSVYYDLKTRLDSSDRLKTVTIYWIDLSSEKHFGTTFNLESQEKLKIVIKPNFFRKELSDYVLRKIELYTG
ncbi:hypothetical protein [Exiguobacterium sp. s162]|uniref:hypothetical protein n=1 Tax=Exiguobacterium sp. s162 TaxID=2751276 RepID=UPI001BE86079|nr:hypothetical protein [Exiguobacterium sp. s162]